MTEEQYARWTAPLRARPRLTHAVVAANRALTVAGYVLYPLLIVLLAAFDRTLVVRCIAVPAIAFAALSLFRRAVNAPRPYEVLAIEPLIAKDTRGKSFPSRHTFSMFMIALTWAVWQPAVGVVLAVASVAMACVRVLGGVHFPRDVVAGAAFAALAAAVGYLVVPW